MDAAAKGDGTETNAPAKKRRGRPPKAAVTVAAPKRRGRPPKAKVEQAAPKRRGRP
ncbi:MAG: transcriptional regulator, partial [Gammaproteobacteria bacterium]|nr:transcriptional regulator [Gammaproteobacteria bacterium]